MTPEHQQAIREQLLQIYSSIKHPSIIRLEVDQSNHLTYDEFVDEIMALLTKTNHESRIDELTLCMEAHSQGANMYDAVSFRLKLHKSKSDIKSYSALQSQPKGEPAHE